METIIIHNDEIFWIVNEAWEGDGTQIYRITKMKPLTIAQVWHSPKDFRTIDEAKEIFDEYQKQLHQWDYLSNKQ